MDVSPQDIRAFITCRADADTKRRILEDLKKSDSQVRVTLEAMRLCAQDLLNVDWKGLLSDDREHPDPERPN